MLLTTLLILDNSPDFWSLLLYSSGVIYPALINPVKRDCCLDERELSSVLKAVFNSLAILNIAPGEPLYDIQIAVVILLASSSENPYPPTFLPFFIFCFSVNFSIASVTPSSSSL